MSEPVKYFPQALSILIQTKVSFDRVNCFSLRMSLKARRCCKIRLQHGDLGWDSEVPLLTLKGTNIEFNKGQKFVICGPVGAGKSSLLLWLLLKRSISSTFFLTSSGTALIQKAPVRDGFGPADENESVREAALGAGHILVEPYAILNERRQLTGSIDGWWSKNYLNFVDAFHRYVMERQTLSSGGTVSAIKAGCEKEVDHIEKQFDDCMAFLLRVLSLKLNGQDVIALLPWDEWWNFELPEDDANPHIALLPLHPDLRAKFNETAAAWEYAQSMIGLPYGYHNLIFSWIDTIIDNYPPLLNANLVAYVMTVWNQMQPAYVANMWNEALNKRLGTKIRYEGANSGGAKPNQTTLNLEAHLLSPSGPNNPNLFTLKVNHGGSFTYAYGPRRTRAPRRVYKDGNADWFDDVDDDGFFVLEVSGMVKELGYDNPEMKFYYKKPTVDLDQGLEPLSKDIDVLDMLSYVNKYKLMEVFIKHSANNSLIDTIDLEQEDASASLGIANECLGNVGNGLGDENVKNVGDDLGYEKGSDNNEGSDDNDESDDSDFECGIEDRIDDVHVDMQMYKDNIDPNEPQAKNNEELVYEEVDLEDFYSEIDSDDDEAERRKALRKLRKCHKPVDGNTYTENFYVSQTFPNKDMIKDMGQDVIALLPWDEWWNFELPKDDANPHIALLPLHPDL
ncbi:transposase, MuDR [Tanacetum coccineum]